MKYVKFDPNDYVFVYKRGKARREGKGLSFWYLPRITSIVNVPIETKTRPFVFSEITSDYQNMTVQGEIIYCISEPKTIIEKVNFAVDSKTLKYISDDYTKISDRIVNVIKTMITKEMAQIQMTDAMRASEAIVKNVNSKVSANTYFKSMGIEITSFNILSILPNAETSRALEANAREKILKEADDAIYDRRNSALEQERKIKENELNTEIAVEKKKQEIKEAQLEAERIVKEKRRKMMEDDMQFQIKQESEKLKLTNLVSKNKKEEADMKAYALTKVLESFAKSDAHLIRSLANMGMDSEKIIANAFDVMAENAEKIGELNISPDLMQAMLKKQG